MYFIPKPDIVACLNIGASEVVLYYGNFFPSLVKEAFALCLQNKQTRILQKDVVNYLLWTHQRKGTTSMSMAGREDTVNSYISPGSWVWHLCSSTVPKLIMLLSASENLSILSLNCVIVSEVQWENQPCTWTEKTGAIWYSHSLPLFHVWSSNVPRAQKPVIRNTWESSRFTVSQSIQSLSHVHSLQPWTA